MKLLAFTIFDTKAQAYGRPFFNHTIPEAIRTFTDAVNAADSPFFRHPEDYLLFHVGSYDDAGGVLEACNPVPLGSASNFKIELNVAPINPEYEE